MLNQNNSTELHHEIGLMLNHISKELTNEFSKTQEEAIQMLKKSKVEESLAKDKLGFHESPYNWAISILTDQNDYEALKNIFFIKKGVTASVVISFLF